MLLLAAAIVVSAGFEGGSIGRVETVAPDHLRCALAGQADQNHRNRQASWYYFRLDHLPHGEVRIDFTDLVGEYNFRPGAHAVTRNTRPVFSYDNRTWRHFEAGQMTWNEAAVELTVRFTPTARTIWIAHMAPYGKPELNRLLAVHSRFVKAGAAGRTAHRRAIPLLTITDPAVPDAGKKVVWLMARQHAWEAGTSWIADGAVRFLLSNDSEAALIRRTTVFNVIPLFDIDGVAQGLVRFNTNGYDNNRNWDTADAATMPEIESVRRTILAAPFDLFLALHNTESADYVNGATADPRVKPVAQRLVDGLRRLTSFHDPASPRDTMAEAIDKGRYTVNQYLYVERKVPAFLMETMVESHPDLKRPRTVQDFSEFGVGVAKSLAACLRSSP